MVYSARLKKISEGVPVEQRGWGKGHDNPGQGDGGGGSGGEGGGELPGQGATHN